MSALVEPSRDAFRPLTPYVVTRHQRVGSCSDRQLPPHALLSSTQGQVSPRDQNRSTVSSCGRSHLPFREKMEEQLRAPSVVSNSLPAFADSPGFSSESARRLAASDRALRHCLPCDVLAMTTAHRFARAAGVTRRLCDAIPALARDDPAAPRDSSGFVGTSCRRPRQRIERFATG